MWIFVCFILSNGAYNGINFNNILFENTITSSFLVNKEYLTNKILAISLVGRGFASGHVEILY